MHGALQMLHREDDIYGGFPSAVLLAPSTLTNGRKLPIIATSSEGTPIGYIITPNPTNADSKFVANETTVQKQQIGSDDASSSSTGHVKSTCNGLLYRLPDGGYAKVEKNYMTINPKLYQQSIYRKLHVHEEWNGPITQANNAQEDNHGIKKKVVVAHESSPVLEGGTGHEETDVDTPQ
ncbi:hypothetical protein EGR_01336 [Echinococcus granulosus]|uniref:Uncharacterized protein n=1 Tax=Echinococcus granulosus TaxID=6210 RepID=W6UR60_ECHGR|nr:hypothetical protein EGR_01336 [Echinococcus granulosus]EUB63713.1 hypothetical protein EGR_01336 [Echinococcus granulosus]